MFTSVFSASLSEETNFLWCKVFFLNFCSDEQIIFHSNCFLFTPCILLCFMSFLALLKSFVKINITLASINFFRSILFYLPCFYALNLKIVETRLFLFTST